MVGEGATTQNKSISPSGFLAPTNKVFVWPVMSIVSFLGILVECCSSWLEFWKAGEPSDIYSRSDHVKSPSAESICTKESTA